MKRNHYHRCAWCGEYSVDCDFGPVLKGWPRAEDHDQPHRIISADEALALKLRDYKEAIFLCNTCHLVKTSAEFRKNHCKRLQSFD